MLSGSDGGERDRYQLRVFGVKPRLPTLSNFSQKRMHRKDSKEVPVSTAVTEQAGASKDRRRLGQGAWDTDIPLWSVPVPARLHSRVDFWKEMIRSAHFGSRVYPCG